MRYNYFLGGLFGGALSFGVIRPGTVRLSVHVELASATFRSIWTYMPPWINVSLYGRGKPLGFNSWPFPRGRGPDAKSLDRLIGLGLSICSSESCGRLGPKRRTHEPLAPYQRCA